ncbi:MAG: hypothetical protein ACJA08_000659 [Cyclobacteriaceae bacterium]|jgi:hypothetical protein
MKGSLLIILLWASLIYACEPCADCGEPLLFEPTVQMKFINRDSLLLLNDTIKTTTDSISSMTDNKDSLSAKVKAWNKLLISLRDSIADGKIQFIVDTLQIDDSINTVGPQITLLDTAIFYTTLLQDSLSDLRTVINSGKVRVDQVTILENGNSTTYSESATLYSLPLIMQNANLTTFLIDLKGKSDTISFQYITELNVDEERRIEMQAYNIDTVSYTYDSLLFECNSSKCKSNEVLVTVYF